MSITDTIEAINTMPEAKTQWDHLCLPTSDLKELATAYTELLEAAKDITGAVYPGTFEKELERLEKATQN